MTSVLIDTYKPKDVIVLGIAGSLSNDLTPGDVFVPTRLVEYLANSSAVGEEVNKFITSGKHFDGDPRLVNRLQNLSVTNEVLYKSWLSKSGRNFKSEIPNEIFEKLKSNEPGSSNFGKAVCHTTKSGEEPTFRLLSGSINSIDPILQITSQQVIVPLILVR